MRAVLQISRKMSPIYVDVRLFSPYFVGGWAGFAGRIPLFRLLVGTRSARGIRRHIFVCGVRATFSRCIRPLWCHLVLGLGFLKWNVTILESPPGAGLGVACIEG